MSDNNALALTTDNVVQVAEDKALAIFTTAGGIDPLLEHIRKEIDAFIPDVTTARGRKDIASIAFKVAKSKTYLDGVGKKLADDVKTIPKKIDATRKQIRDTLDQWRDEVRKPLTDWENAETKRIEGHQALIGLLVNAGLNLEGKTAAELRASLVELELSHQFEGAEEFLENYVRARDTSILALRKAILTQVKYEAEQAELAQLRKEAEERKAAELEKQRMQKIEADKQKCIAEALAKQAAEAERITQRAIEAERRAECAKQTIIDAERKAEERIKRETEETKKREQEEIRKREADKDYRAKVNRAAVSALMNEGLTEDSAKTVIAAIVMGKVPAVKIVY